MSGQELIEKIVKELERDKVPPTDARIMQKLRDMNDVGRVNDRLEHCETALQRRWRRASDGGQR